MSGTPTGNATVSQAAGAAPEVTQAPATPAAEGPRLSRAERMAAVREKAEKEDAGSAPAEDVATDGSPASADAAPDAPAKTKDDPPAAAAKDPAEKPAEKKPEDDKLANKFASLARKEADLQRTRTEHGAAVRAFDDTKRQHEAAHTARAGELDKREARLKEREESDHRMLADTPEKVFQHLQSLGIDTMEKLQSVSKGTWAEGRARMQRESEAAKPVKAEEKPLTQADVDRLFREREQQAAERAKVESLTKSFVDLTEATNEAGEDKYPAAQLVWSRAKRIAKANDIGIALNAQGTKFSSEDLAEALNTLAEQHPRWHKIGKRTAKVGSAVTQSAAGTQAKSVQDSVARNGQPGQSTPVTKEAPKSPPASALNGSTPLNYRDARKQRIAKLSETG